MSSRFAIGGGSLYDLVFPENRIRSFTFVRDDNKTDKICFFY
jgi:hypothetical protein